MDNNMEWHLVNYDEAAAESLGRELGVSITLARLLTCRGINSLEQARLYLNGNLDHLTDPWLMNGMKQAVARIEQAIDRSEPIIIYGDYDADGVCSTVLIVQCLRKLGACVEYYVPDRFSEGYGLNLRAMEKLAAEGYQLMITVDNGISSVEEIARGRELGLDIIITDHHTPPPNLPTAFTIINPRMDSLIESADLSGTGVVFQLCRALGQGKLSNDEVMSWLDLAALATVADAVPLKGDNRIIVRQGLQRLRNTSNLGLMALLQASSLDHKDLAAWHLAFVLGPRINAAGRLKSARLVVDLFLSEDEEQVGQWANDLCELNNRRRAIEEGVTQEVIDYIERQIDLEQERVLIVGGDGWHEGVIGIVASRIAERYNRPAIIIAWEGDGGKGSCRSLPGFNIYEALLANSSGLQHFGGHKLAAGLSLKRQNYEDFRRTLNQWAVDQDWHPVAYRQQLIDLELKPEEITMDLVRELKKLEPFGEDNPSPRFLLRGVDLESYQLMGKGREHFRFRIFGLDGVAFNRADFIKPSLAYLSQDLVVGLEENEFRGKKSIQLRLADMKPASSAFTFDNHNPMAGWLKSMMLFLQGQLEMGQNIIMVFPTYRLLNKQKIFLRRFIQPGVIEELHGCMSYASRRRTERRLQEDSIKICLTTHAYLNYYLRQHRLSEKGYHIINLWSEPVGSEWQQDLQEYPHTIWHWVPGHRFEVKREWSLSQNRRTFIYSNRPTSLRSLTQEFQGLYIEIGLDTLEKRDSIRQSFLSGRAGTLLSDGTYAGLFNGKTIDELVFVDMPFSEYEALAVLHQIAADQDTSICATFGQDAVDFNQTYLERSYPAEGIISAVWRYLCKTDQNPVNISSEGLCRELKPELERVMSILEIEAVLCILVDLGLCEIDKTGSIMAIKLRKSGAADLNLSESPYYLEGLAEKEAFSSWLQHLKEIYAW